MSESVNVGMSESSHPLVGSVRRSTEDRANASFHEESEDGRVAGFVRHHLVDDTWYRCPMHGFALAETSTPCPICLAEIDIEEHVNGLVGQILTIIDAVGSYNEKQSKALKDLLKNTIHGEKESLMTVLRRVLVLETKLEKRKA